MVEKEKINKKFSTPHSIFTIVTYTHVVNVLYKYENDDAWRKRSFNGDGIMWSLSPKKPHKKIQTKSIPWYKIILE